MGRSYWPNERRDRWPTIEPTDMPSIIGDSICIRPPNMARPGSLLLDVGAGGAAADAAAEGAGEVLEQRPVGVEGALRPGAAV